MKAPREIKRWTAILRKRFGKKNGVFRAGTIERIEYKWATDKREKHREARDYEYPDYSSRGKS